MLSCQLFEDKERSLLHGPWGVGEWLFNKKKVYMLVTRNRSQDSSFGISTRLRVGSISGRGMVFFSFPKRLDWIWDLFTS